MTLHYSTLQVQSARAESQAAGRSVGPCCGLFTANVRSIREEARNHLNPQTLLYTSLRQEHRSKILIPYSIAAQRMSCTLDDLWLLQHKTMTLMKMAVAAAQGLVGVANIWYSIITCFESGSNGRVTGIPRKERTKRQEIQDFVTLIAWKCCGRAFPRSCARLLELLFAARWEKLPVGFERGQDHPFSEPIRRSDVQAVAKLDALRRETAGKCRQRRHQACLKVLTDFRAWCSSELYFFRWRVTFWDSDLPQDLRTSTGVHSKLKNLRPFAPRPLPPAPNGDLGVGEEEGEVAFDPSQEVGEDFCGVNLLEPSQFFTEADDGSKSESEEQEEAELRQPDQVQSDQGIGAALQGVQEWLLPCGAFFDQIQKGIVASKTQLDKLPISSTGHKISKTAFRSMSPHTLVVARRVGDRIVFEDDSAASALCWRRIVTGERFATVFGHAVKPGTKLQTAVAAYALFHGGLLPQWSMAEARCSTMTSILPVDQRNFLQQCSSACKKSLSEGFIIFSCIHLRNCSLYRVRTFSLSRLAPPM